jgi:myo-inositol-1(or 4)-monophosphatase
MTDIIPVGIEAARTAGNYILEHFGKVQDIRAKADRNFFTDVDVGAQRLIVDAITARFPGHGIIAEEGNRSREDAECVWIIDPLDGTHNYIRNAAIFGVSIGIVRSGHYVGGIIYMPAADELYVAEKGSGAYKNDKRIAVSSKKSFAECSVSFDSGIRYDPAVLLPVLGDLADKAFNIRMFGSSARSLSYLAEGTIDISVEFKDQPWDCAAGICLIEEAGGTVTDLYGNAMTPATIGYIATNGAMHTAALDIVRAHKKGESRGI